MLFRQIREHCVTESAWQRLQDLVTRQETCDKHYQFADNGRFMYLSVVQDFYNNEIVTHAFSFRYGLTLEFAMLDKRPVRRGAVLHSN